MMHLIKKFKGMKLSDYFMCSCFLYSWVASISEEKLRRNGSILFLLWKCGSEPLAYRTPMNFRGSLLSDPPCRGHSGTK